MLDQILKLISNGEVVDDEVVYHLYHDCIKLTGEAVAAEPDPFLSHSLQQVLGILCWHMRLISEKKAMVGNLLSKSASQSHESEYTTLADGQTLSSNTTSNGTECAEIGAEEAETEYLDQYNSCEIEMEGQGDLLQSMLKQPKLKNGLEDVAGLFEAKRLLNQAIILPSKYPHLFKGGRRPWKRILLYGPPGTGKTRLAHAIAAQAGIPFFCVTSADLLSSWVGESEKLVREVFQKISELPGQSIIFIDEIDGLCRKRNSQEEDHCRRMKTELLNQIEGSNHDDCQDNAILLGATNCPWDLDTAFLRRFQRHIYIPLPDREARKVIITMHSLDGKETDSLLFTESEWDKLLDATIGYSGSDIANLSLSALLEPIRDLEEADFWTIKSNGQMVPCLESHPRAISCKLNDIEADKVATREVKLSDFLKGLTTIPRTNTDEDISKFAEFTKKFGLIG